MLVQVVFINLHTFKLLSANQPPKVLQVLDFNGRPMDTHQQHGGFKSH